MALDLRPPIASALTAFGVDAVVTVPDEIPVSTTALWLAPDTVEVPVGADQVRREQRRIVALRLSDIPQVPRETIISAPEFAGGVVRDWKVDSTERLDYDHVRVIVVPVAS